MTQLIREVTCCDDCLFSYDTIRCDAMDQYFDGPEEEANDRKEPPPEWCPLRLRDIRVRLVPSGAIAGGP